ncbi:hypothetical protein LWE61_17135 [Sphingobium sufflavum]|uniref:hypothetical protein n=1 Tax=Sphingobium sufflavum TaxID=1129547 RepID=UPI001F3857AC|nr:hypothetical protein [Sphingobium sufflavum]MCE7798263.1 hypothetical protein [Sphingobium sufflavum]
MFTGRISHTFSVPIWHLAKVGLASASSIKQHDDARICHGDDYSRETDVDALRDLTDRLSDAWPDLLLAAATLTALYGLLSLVWSRLPDSLTDSILGRAFYGAAIVGIVAMGITQLSQLRAPGDMPSLVNGPGQGQKPRSDRIDSYIGQGFLARRDDQLIESWGQFAIILLTDVGRKEDELCRAFLRSLGSGTPSAQMLIRMDGQTIAVRPIYWPLRGNDTEVNCGTLIEQYDFMRASQMMRRLGLSGTGPFLVSGTLATQDGRPRISLAFDLSDVPSDEMQVAYADFLESYSHERIANLRYAASIRQKIKDGVLKISPNLSALFGIDVAKAGDK